MSEIKVSDIKRALINGTIAIIQNPNDGYIAARCGDYWFYFAGSEAEALTPESFKEEFVIDDTAEMILEAISGLSKNEQNYYYSVLQEAPRWTEIRCNHEQDGFWLVDAWRSDWDYWLDDDIAGEVIAYIDNISGHVLYIDPYARTDKYAQEIIQEKVRDCQYESSNTRNVLFSFIEKNKPFTNDPANDTFLWDQLRALFVSVVISEDLEPDTREVDDFLADIAEAAELEVLECDYEGYVNFMLSYLA